MKWINAEQQVTVTIYDDEHEEYLDKIMTVEEMLDAYTDEGCPTMYSNPEQQPSEDCISRAEVQSLIATWLSDYLTDETRLVLEIIDGRVRDMPSVTPKGVTITDFADRCRECGREKVLDKIRAEIEQTVSRYTISRERDAMGQVEWSDRLIKESEVLQIIDKYKAESEKESEE